MIEVVTVIIIAHHFLLNCFDSFMTTIISFIFRLKCSHDPFVINYTAIVIAIVETVSKYFYLQCIVIVLTKIVIFVFVFIKLTVITNLIISIVIFMVVIVLTNDQLHQEY